MKQRHSFTNLVYHMVFRTKHREHFIHSTELEQALKEYIRNQREHHERGTTIESWEPEE